VPKRFASNNRHILPNVSLTTMVCGRRSKVPAAIIEGLVSFLTTVAPHLKQVQCEDSSAPRDNWKLVQERLDLRRVATSSMSS
jgi:hypothetical protein